MRSFHNLKSMGLFHFVDEIEALKDEKVVQQCLNYVITGFYI